LMAILSYRFVKNNILYPMYPMQSKIYSNKICGIMH
jgi:hypothetical protein